MIHCNAILCLFYDTSIIQSVILECVLFYRWVAIDDIPDVKCTCTTTIQETNEVCVYVKTNFKP